MRQTAGATKQRMRTDSLQPFVIVDDLTILIAVSPSIPLLARANNGHMLPEFYLVTIDRSSISKCNKMLRLMIYIGLLG